MSWGGKKEITEIVLLSAANKNQKKKTKKNPPQSQQKHFMSMLFESLCQNSDLALSKTSFKMTTKTHEEFTLTVFTPKLPFRLLDYL